jgi:hypothetical protein
MILRRSPGCQNEVQVPTLPDLLKFNQQNSRRTSLGTSGPVPLHVCLCIRLHLAWYILVANKPVETSTTGAGDAANHETRPLDPILQKWLTYTI